MLKQLRKAKGLTQKELARRVGITQQAIARYEAQERMPSLRMLKRLARALDVDIAELLNDVSKEDEK